MSLVYLDCETTGLDPQRHEIWEVAWAIDDGPIFRGGLNHSLRYADPQALTIGRYEERRNQGPRASEADLRRDLAGATLAAANPAFDAAFLRARWGESPWRYRLLDVEAYAMGALGLDEPAGLAKIAETLGVAAPDHTAAGDVRTLRECHRALQGIYAEMRQVSEDLDRARMWRVTR